MARRSRHSHRLILPFLPVQPPRRRIGGHPSARAGVELYTTLYKHLLRRLDECQAFYGQEVFWARVAWAVGLEQFYITLRDGRVQIIFEEVFAVAQIQSRHHLPDGTLLFANGLEQFPYRRGFTIQLVGYLWGTCGVLVRQLLRRYAFIIITSNPSNGGSFPPII